MEIKTVEKSVTNTLIVERSKFITFMYPVLDKTEINNILTELRKVYFDATHICYAYILVDEDAILYKSNDDGEPSSTAGAPILNVLKKNNLLNVLCVVIRYFGGIKLGAGGLTRTYGNCASEALKMVNIVTLTDAYRYEISFPYERTRDVDKILEVNQLKVIDKIYDLEVHYFVIFKSHEEAKELYNKVDYLNVKVVFEKDVQISK